MVIFLKRVQGIKLYKWHLTCCELNEEIEMKIEINMGSSTVTPVNILKVIKAFKELSRGDVLEIITKDERTRAYLLKIFPSSQISEIREEEVKDDKVSFKIILKK